MNTLQPLASTGMYNLQCLAFSNHSQTIAECGQNYMTPKVCREKEQLNRCSLNVIAVLGQCYTAGSKQHLRYIGSKIAAQSLLWP